MRIGVPKEIKNHEYRVGVTPLAVKELVRLGHHVSVQSNAGDYIGFTDEVYKKAGAEVLSSAAAVFESELIIKVKEPQISEYGFLRENQTLFTFLHLAPDPQQTAALLNSRVTAIAYETITDRFGALPILKPMSEIAGRLSIQAAAHALECRSGGKGLLLGGTVGVMPARVLIIGAGVAGRNAAKIAIGVGADVTVIDCSVDQLEKVEEMFGSSVKTAISSTHLLVDLLPSMDVVIGAVLIPGAQAPKLMNEEMVKLMQKGSVLIDISIDQGGCFATSRPTSHDMPTYLIDGVIHYCVPNMPSLVARTATLALTNATLPFIIQLANQGVMEAMAANEHLRRGLNTYAGEITNKSVANALKQDYSAPEDFLKISR